ncbi:MAG: formate dehydrogenase subunit delta [Planctomycetes bacterium]|nr:formate dehydrogenase subunit delta [Planctomycetota bacterium]
MDGPKLVRMANQIATFFATEPVRALAVEGVAGHLKRFWEPRMRRELLAMHAAGPVPGLHELVAEALRTQRAQLEPAARG